MDPSIANEKEKKNHNDKKEAKKCRWIDKIDRQIEREREIQMEREIEREVEGEKTKDRARERD